VRSQGYRRFSRLSRFCSSPVASSQELRLGHAIIESYYLGRDELGKGPIMSQTNWYILIAAVVIIVVGGAWYYYGGGGGTTTTATPTKSPTQQQAPVKK
jgi:hypothetical protein